MHVVVHLESSLANFVESKCLTEYWMNHAFGNQSVGLPSLLVVSEMATYEILQSHPKMSIVKFHHEATCGCTGHNGATALSDINRSRKC